MSSSYHRFVCLTENTEDTSLALYAVVQKKPKNQPDEGGSSGDIIKQTSPGNIYIADFIINCTCGFNEKIIFIMKTVNFQ